MLLACSWALAVLAIAPGPTAAAASDDPDREDDPTVSGMLDLGIAARRDTGDPQAGPREVASLSPMLRLGLRVRPEVEIVGAMGVASIFTRDASGKDASARPSNLVFGGRRVWSWGGDRYRSAFVGFDFAIPTGYVDSDDEAAAYEYALASRGGENPWEWQPRNLGLVVPAAVEAQVGKRWVLGGRVGAAAMLPAIDDVAPPGAAAQIDAHARFVLPWLGLGLRGAAVYNGRRDGDRTQVSLAPSVDTSLCRRGGRRIAGSLAPTSTRCPVSAIARLHVNVDGPYGFVSRDSMGIWGLQLALAWAL